MKRIWCAIGLYVLAVMVTAREQKRAALPELRGGAAAVKITPFGANSDWKGPILPGSLPMAKRISARMIPVFLAAVSVSSQQAGPIQQPSKAEVIPLKNFSPIHRFETLSGDPAKSGPYVIRIHAEAGYVIMPHIHPEDENIVVVQGSWAAGMGERFNPQALQSMEVGTYALLPKKMAHFALSETHTIIQVHGLGPFTPRYVTPNYELTDKGIFLKTILTEPAQLASTSPPDCFPLKLEIRVHGNSREGVVVAAQCTPGQLTQYRIEKPDGDHFWAQRDELKVP